MFARTRNLLLRPAFDEDASLLTSMIASELSFGDLVAVPRPSDYLVGGASLPKLLVFLRTDGAPLLIGTASLTRNARGDVELSCWISSANRGRGFGGEAVEALMGMATDGLRLKKIVARHRQDDQAAAHVLARLGFRPCRGSPGTFVTAIRREPSRLVVSEPAAKAA